MSFKKLLGLYSGLPRSMYVIFFARVINSIGNFVMPFLAIFLTDDMGMTKLQAGRFVMAAAVAYVPGSIIGGKLSDHIGRKKVLVIFQGLAALCFLACGFPYFTNLIPWLLIGSSFFGGGAAPSHMAMVTDLTNSENRKQAFSFLYLGNNIGFAMGPMIAGFLYKSHLSWIFFGDALTTFISLAMVIIYINETMPSKEAFHISVNKPSNNEKAEEGGIIKVLLQRPILLTFSIIMMILSFVYTQYTFSLPIQVNDIFKDEGPRHYGLLMTVSGLTVVSLTPVITAFTMKLKPTFSIFLGGLLYTAGYGMIYFISSMPAFIISTIMWTTGEVLVTTNSGVYIANNTPVTHRGRFNAVLPIIMGTGYAFGPYLAGGFMDIYGVRPVWLLILGLSLGSSFLMIILQEVEQFHRNRLE